MGGGCGFHFFDDDAVRQICLHISKYHGIKRRVAMCRHRDTDRSPFAEHLDPPAEFEVANKLSLLFAAGTGTRYLLDVPVGQMNVISPVKAAPAEKIAIFNNGLLHLHLPYLHFPLIR